MVLPPDHKKISIFFGGIFMMKNMKIGIALLMVITVLFLAGCQQESLSSDATLQSVTIAGIAPQSMGTPHTDWLEVVHGDIYLSDAQLKDVQVETSIPDGADVWLARGPLGAPPSFDKETSYPILEHDDVVWVEIFSANLDTYLIYGFKIHKKTPLLAEVNLLKSLSIAAGMMGTQTRQYNRSAVSFGTPAASLAGVTSPGELYVGTSELAGTTSLQTASGQTLTLKAVPEMLDTDIRMTIASGSAAPNFTTPDLEILGKSNGDFLYIETTSGQGEKEVLYYKIRLVAKNDSFDLGTVTINGQTVTPGLMGWDSFAGSEYYSFMLGDAGYLLGAKMATSPANGSVAAIAEANANITIALTPPPTSGIRTTEYAHIDVDSRYAAEGRLNYGTSGSLGNLPNGEWIAVKVTNEVGDTGWYRFQITKP
jgi:hypothetical protein